jgi:hypothetical protein
LQRGYAAPDRPESGAIMQICALLAEGPAGDRWASCSPWGSASAAGPDRTRPEFRTETDELGRRSQECGRTRDQIRADRSIASADDSRRSLWRPPGRPHKGATIRRVASAGAAMSGQSFSLTRRTRDERIIDFIWNRALRFSCGLLFPSESARQSGVWRAGRIETRERNREARGGR